MKPGNPPRLATAILQRLAPGAEALRGDFQEEFVAGRSRGWYWAQVVSAIAIQAWQDSHAHKRRTVLGVLVGWGTLLAFFFVASGPLFQATSRLIVGQSVRAGLDNFTTIWWTYWAPLPASLIGFAVSGWIVARFGRTPGLLLYAATVVLILMAAAGIDWNTEVPIPVPHAVFYYTIVPAFRFFWSVGLIVVPLLVLIVGVWAMPRKQSIVE